MGADTTGADTIGLGSFLASTLAWTGDEGGDGGERGLSLAVASVTLGFVEDVLISCELPLRLFAAAAVCLPG